MDDSWCVFIMLCNQNKKLKCLGHSASLLSISELMHSGFHEWYFSITHAQRWL